MLQVFRNAWDIIGITLLTFAVLELLARIGFGVQETWLVDSRLAADVYENQDRAEDYFREFLQSGDVEWYSYVYWRRKPYQGKYINIDNKGIRRTWNKPASSKDVKIFMFGGSTLWGTGARDEFTIPSLVSKKLQAKWGTDVQVTNYGESGYVSTQELIALMLELQRGNVPDIVVFYDGVNDTFAAFQSGVAGIPQNESNRVAVMIGLQT